MKKKNIFLIFSIIMISLLAAVPVSAKPKYSKVYGNLLKKEKYEFNSGIKYNGKTQKRSVYLNDIKYSYSLKYRKSVKTIVPWSDKSVKFQLLDLDGNGVKELIVRKENTNHQFFYYFFTIKSGKLKYVPLVTDEDRFLYSEGVLKWNKSKKLLAFRTTSSTSISGESHSDEYTYFYKYNKGKLSMIKHTSKSTSSDGKVNYGIYDGNHNSIISGYKTSSWTEETFEAAKEQYDTFNNYYKNAKKKVAGSANNPTNRTKKLK